MRTLVQRELNAALGEWDLLLSPAAPTTAYRIGEAWPTCWLHVHAASCIVWNSCCMASTAGLRGCAAMRCLHVLQAQLVNTETMTRSAMSSARSFTAAWARCATTRWRCIRAT